MKLKKLPWTIIAMMAMMLVLLSPSAYAGKVDEVKKAVKDTCGKELPSAEILDAVLKAYDCTPASDVAVGDCKIKCLKEAGGNVVGGK